VYFLVDELGDMRLNRNGKMGYCSIRYRLGWTSGYGGYVTRFGLPRLSGDVQNDPVYVASPLLPETRSELSLPMRSGQKIIGALDIQSSEPYYFTKNDQIALQSIADQLASAIEILRLTSQVQTTLTETERIIQMQTSNNWERLFPNHEFWRSSMTKSAKHCDQSKSIQKSDRSAALHLNGEPIPARLAACAVKLLTEYGTIVVSQDADHLDDDEITIEGDSQPGCLDCREYRLLAESQHGPSANSLSRVTGNSVFLES
jgi:hypothetical protein